MYVFIQSTVEKSSSCKQLACLYSLALYFSRFSPDVNLRSPGNRNSQADLQRLQTGGKIRVDFPLWMELSLHCSAFSKQEHQRLSVQDSLFTFDMAGIIIIISWVLLST